MESVRETYLTDQDGNTIRLYAMPDGLFLPVVPGFLGRLEELKDFTPYEDDVFIFAFPKSGTHWTWEIVNMLLQGTKNYSSFYKDEFMLESLDLLDSHPRPRLITSHLPVSYIPKGILRNGNKIIHVLRNPKDVAVSFYNHTYYNKAWQYNGTWPAYLEMFAKGKVGWLVEDEGWFGYEKQWEQARTKYPDVPILFVYYEELLKNPFDTVKTISEFLDLKYDDEFYKAVIVKCSFDSMKADKPYTEANKGWRDGEVKVYLNGKIGTWKKWFTVKQNEDFDELFRRKMQNSSLQFNF